MLVELPWLDTGVEGNDTDEVMLLPTLWVRLLGGLVVFLGIVLLPWRVVKSRVLPSTDREEKGNTPSSI